LEAKTLVEVEVLSWITSKRQVEDNNKTPKMELEVEIEVEVDVEVKVEL